MFGTTQYLIIGSFLSSVSINWTVLMAIVAFCLSAMATLIKIFGSDSKINDQNLRDSPYLKFLEQELKEKDTKFNNIKELVNEQHTEVEKIKTELNNNSKTMTELKQDNRDLVQRLDYLLKQFMEYMEG